MNKEKILNNGHWVNEDYKQRITPQEWGWLLYKSDDYVVFNGELRKLKGTFKSSEVIEIQKESLKEK